MLPAVLRCTYQLVIITSDVKRKSNYEFGFHQSNNFVVALCAYYNTRFLICKGGKRNFFEEISAGFSAPVKNFTVYGLQRNLANC